MLAVRKPCADSSARPPQGQREPRAQPAPFGRYAKGTILPKCTLTPCEPTIRRSLVKIIYYPHPTLRHESKPVRRVDAELRAAVAEMFELMYEAKGIGLAANQVDLPYRLFVINLASDSKQAEEEHVFINPVLSRPKGSATAEEGCLSLPGLYADVTRPASIQVSAYGLDGQAFDGRVEGLMARVIQHETDHLDGVLFIDKLSETEAAEVRPALDEFEADFNSRRQVGEIGDDRALAENRTALEKKYC